MSSKVALVTGSYRGIGLATVSALLSKGYTTILTSRNPESARAAIEQLSGKGELHYHQLDVTIQHSVDACRAWVEQEFGRLDVLINNAGINYDTWQNAATADLRNVQDTMDVNLYGAWRMAMAFIPVMQRNGGGNIVNVSSGAGSLNDMTPGTPAYSISKAAMNVLTIQLAAEVANDGILVNAVCPGWVRTEMGGQAAPRSPQEGAAGIVWLAELETGGYGRPKHGQ